MMYQPAAKLFLSTLSLRRATNACRDSAASHPKFLSTLSLRRATEDLEPSTTRKLTFLSTLSLRRATLDGASPLTSRTFLSTLSLRRATREGTSIKPILCNFYPRSPCGERHEFQQGRNGQNVISIHALLAESDQKRPKRQTQTQNFYPRSPCGERPDGLFFIVRRNGFLSTLSLRRATRNSQNIKRRHNISIHALLAESDDKPLVSFMKKERLFLSTLSLRRATQELVKADTGEHLFLSTLSLRRATVEQSACPFLQSISIHALLAESDVTATVFFFGFMAFLSTLSLRRATP